VKTVPLAAAAAGRSLIFTDVPPVSAGDVGGVVYAYDHAGSLLL
jgi:hypothetical protein